MEELKCPQNLDRQWVGIKESLLLSASTPILLDFRETVSIDSAGIALVHLMSQNRSVEITHIRQSILDQIEIIRPLQQKEDPQKSVFSFEHVGDVVWKRCLEFRDALTILVEMLYWGTIGLFKRQDFRKGILGEQMFHLGYGALPITMVLTFLIGVAVAAQAAIQLKTFGADIFLVALVVMGMIRELGPLMAAIILAGRTGSATTAEIATMQVQEEVDALKTMGLNEIQFIVVPKFWALSITMPLLTVLATFSGIFGGLLVGYAYLGLTPQMIFDEFLKNIIVKDFVISTVKSLVFSWLIIWIGAYYGLQVRGGAEEVGQATTRSVVTSIFVIVVVDAIFSFFY